MSTTRRLSKKAIDDSEIVSAKLQSIQEMNVLSGKDNLPAITGATRLLGRRESNRLASFGMYDQTSSNISERKSSKSFLVSTRPGMGLSIFRVVQAARAWQRISHRRQTIPEQRKVQFENNYKLCPEKEQIFRQGKVKDVIQNVVTNLLRNFKYTAEGAKTMCLNISTDLKSAVKRMEFPRYKYVCNVIIMQNQGQGSQISSRCIWDLETDSFATFTFKTNQVVCVANVHAVYFE